METCNLSLEDQEIQSQFIESVPGFSEFGTGMVAAISHMTHQELTCLREFMTQEGEKSSITENTVGITNKEFEVFREYISNLEKTILDVITPEAKQDGYITFHLTEKNRQGLGEYTEFISLLYRSRNVYGIGDAAENIEYLKLPQWDGSRKIRIMLGKDTEKYFIKYIQIVPVEDLTLPEDGEIPPQDYKTEDGKYLG